ncbi:uncharacterized protein LOC124180025 [Neodiprion fabricii]|uniref:uncharacterized protein LOC124180025 n=1 Tax=Neodiprion fabricii TaxID=2872261 RepID=UPI001ED965C8|nr:uncharacterized protein LOC124180025 [Neodiprion fabricii]
MQVQSNKPVEYEVIKILSHVRSYKLEQKVDPDKDKKAITHLWGKWLSGLEQRTVEMLVGTIKVLKIPDTVHRDIVGLGKDIKKHLGITVHLIEDHSRMYIRSIQSFFSQWPPAQDCRHWSRPRVPRTGFLPTQTKFMHILTCRFAHCYAGHRAGAAYQKCVVAIFESECERRGRIVGSGPVYIDVCIAKLLA